MEDLDKLVICGGRIDGAWVAPLLSRMPRLRHLVVSGAENSEALCVAIAESPIVSQLVTLDMRQGDFTPRAIEILSTSALRSLKTLELSGTPIGARARLQHLAPSVRVHDG